MAESILSLTLRSPTTCKSQYSYEPQEIADARATYGQQYKPFTFRISSSVEDAACALDQRNKPGVFTGVACVANPGGNAGESNLSRKLKNKRHLSGILPMKINDKNGFAY